MVSDIEAFETSNLLLSAIYDGIKSPVGWEKALEAVRQAMNVDTAILRATILGRASRNYLHIAAPNLSEEMIASWDQFSPYDLLPVAGVHENEIRVIDWHSQSLRPEIVAHLRRCDIGRTICAFVAIMDQAEYTLHCSRGSSAKPFSERDKTLLGMVAGHFRRAIALRGELAEIRMQKDLHVDALDQLGIGVVLVRHDQPPVMLNSVARRLEEAGDFFKARGDQIHATNDMDRSELLSSIREALSVHGSAFSHAMNLRSANGSMNIIIRSREIKLNSTGCVDRLAIIFLKLSEALDDCDVAFLQKKFSFTRTEANIAFRLANSMRMESIENELKIAHNTARTHLRSMFSKTNSRNRSELVNRVANSLAPLGRGRYDTIQ